MEIEAKKQIEAKKEIEGKQEIERQKKIEAKKKIEPLTLFVIVFWKYFHKIMSKNKVIGA